MYCRGPGPHSTQPVVLAREKNTSVPLAKRRLQTAASGSEPAMVALPSGAPSGMSNAQGQTGSEPHQEPQMWSGHGGTFQGKRHA